MDKVGSFFLPPGNSSYATGVDALFFFIFYVSIALFAIVTIASVYFAIRYRRRGARTLTSGVDHNTKLELVWTIIPTILVFVIFLWGFKGYLDLHVVPKDAIEIKVTGQKWFWSLDYPEGMTTVNELVVPVGKPIKLLMSSKDVIHSFYLPAFRIKQDVLPNRYTIVWFDALNTGEFDLFCAEYCGKGHSEMIGKVRVLGEREYSQWVESQSQIGQGMTLEEYGAKLYKAKGCVTCHTIDGKASTGPTFKGVFGHHVKLSTGAEVAVDENYIRESLLNPMTKVVAGYQPVMPTFQGILKDREIDALIAYIKSVKE